MITCSSRSTAPTLNCRPRPTASPRVEFELGTRNFSSPRTGFYPPACQKSRETERSEILETLRGRGARAATPWAEVGGLTCSPPGENIPIFGVSRIDPLPDNSQIVASVPYSLPHTGSNPPSIMLKSGKVGENNPIARVSPHRSTASAFRYPRLIRPILQIIMGQPAGFSKAKQNQRPHRLPQ